MQHGVTEGLYESVYRAIQARVNKMLCNQPRYACKGESVGGPRTGGGGWAGGAVSGARKLKGWCKTWEGVALPDVSMGPLEGVVIRGDG